MIVREEPSKAHLTKILSLPHCFKMAQCIVSCGLTHNCELPYFSLLSSEWCRPHILPIFGIFMLMWIPHEQVLKLDFLPLICYVAFELFNQPEELGGKGKVSPSLTVPCKYLNIIKCQLPMVFRLRDQHSFGFILPFELSPEKTERSL